MKNLGLVFCSFRPTQYPSEVGDLREQEYFHCLKQLYRVIPSNYDLQIIDNTINNLSDLKSHDLRNFLESKDFHILGQNRGNQNKGIGELDMLIYLMNRLNFQSVITQVHNSYDKVTYITGRRLFTCPYFFELTNKMKKSALICNPDFVYLDGRIQISEKEGLYNDMIFSMTTELIKKYSDYSDSKTTELLKEGIGSEQNLYNFIHTNNVDFEWTDFIGLIRVDWLNDFSRFDIKNIHIN